jgi:hypothetical protein
VPNEQNEAGRKRHWSLSVAICRLLALRVASGIRTGDVGVGNPERDRWAAAVVGRLDRGGIDVMSLG